MTQLFNNSASSANNPQNNTGTEKRNFPTISLTSRKHSGDASHFPTKLKNFFRINSSSSTGSGNSLTSPNNSLAPPKPESKSTFRQSRFLPNIGRNRSATVASEGNPLEDDGVSPTAHANPYFAHQGYPALRHRNDDSVPNTPPDTPALHADGGATGDQPTATSKEELARKLRRVASAPNAQGLFTSSKNDGRPQTAELGKEPLVQHGSTPKLSFVDQTTHQNLDIPDASQLKSLPSLGQLRNSVAFRRTYSSNSIKVRNVEVGPGSFDKIKLIGKGDVGKVYLVREKKSNRLYAMKGLFYARNSDLTMLVILIIPCSAEQEGNDQEKQDQAGAC